MCIRRCSSFHGLRTDLIQNNAFNPSLVVQLHALILGPRVYRCFIGRWLITAVVRNWRGQWPDSHPGGPCWIQGGVVGICGGQTGTGARFLKVFLFLNQALLHTHRRLSSRAGKIDQYVASLTMDIINIEASRILNVNNITRQLKRKKSFELVRR
jgi:hypothetical protein